MSAALRRHLPFLIQHQRPPVTVSAAVLVTPPYVANTFTDEFDERLCVLTVKVRLV